ncbi:hypothetical protein C7C46_08995 [Streptomyces tateyamensis]|uniref:Siphovirus-type tail component C-terminal domain-containing protein n=2 Tax=Streptomyces tateyamensis TaxID=565073 RepID=A0A2V4PE07_9ACTN|nr:hypothetical protein C7C46_08995 [Streptomyces tateyamensis]
MQYAERQADHGSWAGPTYLTARVLTLTGTIVALDQATLEAAMEQLRAAVGVSDVVLTVRETIPKQCTARRSGKLLLERITDRTATYSVLVTAPDPRRYSTTLQQGSTGLPSTTGGLVLPLTLPLTMSSTTVSGSITAANAGSMATRPVLTITGPVVQPVITVQAAGGAVTQLAYGDQLGAGDTLVLDCDAHTAVLNGTASRRRYLSGPWPEIAAGSTATLLFRAASGSAPATLSASWRSAWM